MHEGYGPLLRRKSADCPAPERIAPHSCREREVFFFDPADKAAEWGAR